MVIVIIIKASALTESVQTDPVWAQYQPAEWDDVISKGNNPRDAKMTGVVAMEQMAVDCNVLSPARGHQRTRTDG